MCLELTSNGFEELSDGSSLDVSGGNIIDTAISSAEKFLAKRVLWTPAAYMIKNAIFVNPNQEFYA